MCQTACGCVSNVSIQGGATLEFIHWDLGIGMYPIPKHCFDNDIRTYFYLVF